jgi:hypothetical protein
MTVADEAMTYVTGRIAQMLKDCKGTDIVKAVDMIKSAKKVFVYGVGRSGPVSRAFAMRLVQVGLEVYFIGETITQKQFDFVKAPLVLVNTSGFYDHLMRSDAAHHIKYPHPRAVYLSLDNQGRKFIGDNPHIPAGRIGDGAASARR